MKMRSRAVADLSFVEPIFEHCGVFAAPRIAPPQNNRGVIALSIYANETVPKATRGDACDLAFEPFCLFKHGIDGGDHIGYRMIRIDLISAVGRDMECLFNFYRRSWDEVGVAVI